MQLPMPKPLAALRFIVAYASFVRDPAQLDRVFALLDGIDAQSSDGHGPLAHFLARPDVAAVMAEPRDPLTVDIADLRRLPADTLGRAFSRFVDERGLDISELYRPGRDTEQPFDRLRLHLERSHDLWHVVTGFATDTDGELGLQAFYLAQIEAPLAAAILSAGLLNGLLYAPQGLGRRMEIMSFGWEYGRQARSLMGADWAALLREPLEVVRTRFGIDETMVSRAAAFEPAANIDARSDARIAA
ncbi:MAG: hypothetical protein KC457_24795 [Myxococcales bacterium]|nr:hypothetical protein [Myxococcales bacterium]